MTQIQKKALEDLSVALNVATECGALDALNACHPASDSNNEVDSRSKAEVLATLQFLLMYVFLFFVCTGITLWVLPYTESAFELVTCFPAALAIYGLWKSFNLYNELNSLLRKN